jgi:two-component system phosphate regulon sensor histidine kinase PhoR
LKLTLSWRWFFGMAVLLVVLLFVINVCLDLALPPFLVRKIRTDLERDAVITREFFSPHLLAAQPDSEEINRLAHALAAKTGLRITVIAVDGTVIGESDKPAAELHTIENHLRRSEVQQAIDAGIGVATRHSDTVGVDLMYVAVPVNKEHPVGFVRVALPLHEIALTTGHVRRIVALASIAVGCLCVPLVFWLAGRTSRPILQMCRVAERVARGDFSKSVSTRIGGELGELAAALNDMSAQLEARVRDLNLERADLGAILANMTEGVLVTDSAGRIRLINNALRRQHEVGDEIVGKTVIEAFRNAALQDLVANAVGQNDVPPQELIFLGPAERVFEVNAAALRAPDGNCAGVVLVFHDITRLKRLENVRKEFVANVSHELRTPLSAIKGYVEALLDEQPPTPEIARQFLETIEKNSRRLEALINDLLTISALESQQAWLEFKPVDLHAAAQAAVEELAAQAARKSIAFALEIPAETPCVSADAERLHQVFINLLDNAIKYTQDGSRVVISAWENAGEIEVCVADNGPGIGAEHLPRIFERFYRVDKARSRELGGTGLGLSIVKHIVQAHGGRVWAESSPRSERGELGHGSRFFFTLPRA